VRGCGAGAIRGYEVGAVRGSAVGRVRGCGDGAAQGLLAEDDGFEGERRGRDGCAAKPWRAAEREGGGDFVEDGGVVVEDEGAVTAVDAALEQAYSVDGGKPWETNWIMSFTRMAP
jgi:hypothetical protein